MEVQPPDLAAFEAPYLKRAMREFAGLPLEGRAKEDTLAPDKPLRLDRVYIPLNTNEMRWRKRPPGEERPFPIGTESEPLSALRAVTESQRLVLLGEPGAGKSIFAQHLCLCLAGARLDATGEWPSQLRAAGLDRWTLPFYFPIFVRLRAFAADTTSLPDDPKERGRANHLLAFIQKELADQGWCGLADHVVNLLAKGRAFVLLDGLDEVTHPRPEGDPAKADAARREKVAEAIADFAHVRFRHARVLVTCRVRQYPLRPPASWALPGFPVTTLADFDPDQVRKFVAAWFDELSTQLRIDPAHKRSTFQNALDSRRELADLAPKPIVLTQMALVHASRELPGSRVGVYSEAPGCCCGIGPA